MRLLISSVWNMLGVLLVNLVFLVNAEWLPPVRNFSIQLLAKKIVAPSFSNKIDGELVLNYDTKRLYYTSEIIIGNPPRAFSLLLDTASADIWVSGVLCEACGDPFKGSRYDSKKSKTYKNDGRSFEILFAYGQTVKGTTAKESIYAGSIFETTGVEVENQGFAIINERIGDEFRFDRVFGLAFPKLSKTKFDTFLRKAYNQEKIDWYGFSIWLSTLGIRGRVILGGYDPKYLDGKIFFSFYIDSD